MAKAKSPSRGGSGVSGGSDGLSSNSGNEAAAPGGENIGLLTSGDGRDDGDDDIFGDEHGSGSGNDSLDDMKAPADARRTPSRTASGTRLPPNLVTSSANGSSSLRTPRTPRTPNRVRFDLRPVEAGPPSINGHTSSLRNSRAHGDYSDDDDDDMDHFDLDNAPENLERQHRLPLLTEIEAPSVTLARSGEIDTRVDVEEWAERERSRPKSGLSSAFMNMANSIIGAGIIGQPYAMKQAGLVAGVVLLVVLTVLVDWTIRLIVVNSKLSGASSFQGTVEHCFGRTGLIAISVAQWVFAFGGMVAFGVIVGDSIPHVLTAVWPGLHDVPVLGLLTDRRVVIVVFTLSVSYPLTLYRDIAKLAKASTFALVSMVVIIVTVVVQGAMVPKEERGSFSRPLLTVNSGIFQAIGVISFGWSLGSLLFFSFDIVQVY
jgi:solute carrier family 38 (sodium-coupled neutral amino acid transporter), member 11